MTTISTTTTTTAAELPMKRFHFSYTKFPLNQLIADLETVLSYLSPTVELTISTLEVLGSATPYK
jgi:hypothetical protein